jgi:hypothetical protein
MRDADDGVGRTGGAMIVLVRRRTMSPITEAQPENALAVCGSGQVSWQTRNTAMPGTMAMRM